MFLPSGIYLAVRLNNITGRDWLWCVILLVVMMLICIPLSETPLKKWVIRQEKVCLLSRIRNITANSFIKGGMS